MKLLRNRWRRRVSLSCQTTSICMRSARTARDVVAVKKTNNHFKETDNFNYCSIFFVSIYFLRSSQGDSCESVLFFDTHTKKYLINLRLNCSASIPLILHGRWKTYTSQAINIIININSEQANGTNIGQIYLCSIIIYNLYIKSQQKIYSRK